MSVYFLILWGITDLVLSVVAVGLALQPHLSKRLPEND